MKTKSLLMILMIGISLNVSAAVEKSKTLSVKTNKSLTYNILNASYDGVNIVSTGVLQNTKYPTNKLLPIYGMQFNQPMAVGQKITYEVHKSTALSNATENSEQILFLSKSPVPNFIQYFEDILVSGITSHTDGIIAIGNETSLFYSNFESSSSFFLFNSATTFPRVVEVEKKINGYSISTNGQSYFVNSSADIYPTFIGIDDANTVTKFKLE